MTAIGKYVRALAQLPFITPAEGMEHLPGELLKIQPLVDCLGDSRFERKVRYHAARLLAAANRAASFQRRHPSIGTFMEPSQLGRWQRWIADLDLIFYERRRAGRAVQAAGGTHASRIVMGLFYSGFPDALDRVRRAGSSPGAKLLLGALFSAGLTVPLMGQSSNLLPEKFL